MRAARLLCCVRFRVSRRGLWLWEWFLSTLGHCTVERATGFHTREDAVIAFCLTADSRGYTDLAHQVSHKELRSL